MRRSLIPIFNELEDIKDFFSAFDSTLPNISREELSGISLYEDENKLYIEAAVPGIRPEDLCVTFDKGILWIKGENKQKVLNYVVRSILTNAFSVSPNRNCRNRICTSVSSPSSGESYLKQVLFFQKNI